MDLIAVSVGNTRTRFGLFRGRELDRAAAVESVDQAGIVRAISEMPLPRDGVPIVMASVNDPAADPLEADLRREYPDRVYRFGRDLTIPIRHGLHDSAGAGVGQDRLLNALAAYSRAQQACIIVDAGTAVTVDFVDGQGVFQGGAIAPGVNMMLRALHEQTAALPEVRFRARGDEGGGPLSPVSPFGKDTREAMLLGVAAAVVGMTRLLAERYAEHYAAYPQIIATGGDARALFENDEVVEMIVPELTLLGVQAACEVVLAGDEH